MDQLSTNISQRSQQHVQDKSQLQSSTYNWLGVLQFLNEQYKDLFYQESEWLLEKQQLNQKLAKLEGEVKASENINRDLIKRIQMLQFSLRQERIKYSKLLQGEKYSNDVLKQVLSENNENSASNMLPSVPQRKAKSSRPLLTKILEQVGLDDIFSHEALANDLEHLNSINNNSNINNSQVHQKNASSTNFNNESVINMNSSQLKKFMGESEETKNSLSSPLKPSNSMKSLAKTNQIDAPPVQTSNTNQRISPKFLKEEQFSKEPEFLSELAILKNHLDGVRDLVFLNDKNLVSVSEDCMVKLWDLQSIGSNQNESAQIEPYLTLRQHTGPLFTATAVPSDIIGENIIYTSGSQGIIKCWKIPDSKEISSYGPTQDQSYCIGTWNSHEQAVWQLIHHPIKNQLLSSSADGAIALWNVNYQNLEEQLVGNCKRAYTYRPSNGTYLDTPTSITFLNTHVEAFAAGYVNTPSIVVFDNETGKTINVIQYTVENQKLPHQINQLVSHNTMNLLVSAHDDKNIRLFDLNSNKMVQNVQAHNDSVTGISIHYNQINISSVSHDGTLRSWDIRKLQSLHDPITIHKRKYDETIHNIVCNPFMDHLGTAGADGDIGIFQINK